MELTSTAPIAGAAHAQQRFTINLLASGEAQPTVRSCEVSGSGMRQRTSFTENCAIEDVFEDRVAAGLRDCLARLEDGERVLSLPDFLIEVEGLVLAGVQLMVRQQKDGERAVIVRFRALVGLVQRIFHPRLGMNDPLAGVSERIALEMLCDVGLPLLDLCAAHEGDFAGNLQERFATPSRLLQNADELRFRLELIKRYLKALDRPQVARRHDVNHTIRQRSGELLN